MTRTNETSAAAISRQKPEEKPTPIFREIAWRFLEREIPAYWIGIVGGAVCCALLGVGLRVACVKERETRQRRAVRDNIEHAEKVISCRRYRPSCLKKLHIEKIKRHHGFD
mgnify:CR=1 FL=1